MSNRKLGTVIDLVELKPGTVVDVSDYQVVSTRSDGSLVMATMKIEEENLKGKKLENYEIKKGFYRVTPKNGLISLDIPDELYFETDTSRELASHFNVFRKKLDLIRARKKNKRSILLGSEPGQGKSSCIRNMIRDIRNENVCVLKIDSDDISWELLTQMFMQADPTTVDYVLLVLEDLGGTALDERRHHIGADCLNFLDGNSEVFLMPTFIIGTTNFIDSLGQTLTNRPGRFDVVLHVEPPKDEEVFVISEGYLGRPLTNVEKRHLGGHEFTPAYVGEILDRVELYDIDIERAVEQILKQRKKSEKREHGTKDATISLGFDD